MAADQTVCSDQALRAAVALARARNGDDTTSGEHLRALLLAAGPPHDIARATALVAGALGQAIVEHGALGADVDGTDIAAAGLRRLTCQTAIRPDAVPFADGLLTTVLVTRTDAVAWIDQIGPAPGQLAPAVEVLASLVALVDTVHAQPGLGAELLASVVT